MIFKSKNNTSGHRGRSHEKCVRFGQRRRDQMVAAWPCRNMQELAAAACRAALTGPGRSVGSRREWREWQEQSYRGEQEAETEGCSPRATNARPKLGGHRGGGDGDRDTWADKDVRYETSLTHRSDSCINGVSTKAPMTIMRSGRRVARVGEDANRQSASREVVFCWLEEQVRGRFKKRSSRFPSLYQGPHARTPR